MVDTIGLIERAAALLRQQEATDSARPVPPLNPAGEPAITFATQLVLDRGRLAGFGIAIPSAARSRTVAGAVAFPEVSAVAAADSSSGRQ